VLFKQLDCLLSSGYPCTIHLRTKTKWLPFRSGYRRANFVRNDAAVSSNTKKSTKFFSFSVSVSISKYQYKCSNRQLQLLVYACRGRWEVRYHIADHAEKIKMVAV
jgi:hypothetical protein